MAEQDKMVLRAEHLIKKYGKRTVVGDVSFDVKQGEIVGLLGPNGAGKTTSFYMTTGLVVPNGGRIFIDNQEITSDPVYKRARVGIGYLAQEASVFRKMSVEDNIASVLEMTAAAMLCYDNDGEDKWRAIKAEKDAATILTEIGGVPADHPCFARIMAHYAEFCKK